MQDGCSLWINSVSANDCAERHEDNNVKKIVDTSVDGLWKNLTIIMPAKEEKPFHKEADAKDAVYWNDEWNIWYGN